MKFTGRIREPEKLTASFPALKLPLSGGYEEGYADGRTDGYTEGEQAAQAVAEAHNAAILTDCNAVLPDKGVKTADTLEQVPQRIEEIQSYSDGYDVGLEDGKQAEYDRFWDAYQQGGNRRNYSRAFYHVGWTDETFKPKYDIVMTGGCEEVTANSQITNLEQILINCGVRMDTSGVTSAYTMFRNSGYLTHLPYLDLSKATSLSNAFQSCKSLQKLHMKISENASLTNTFYGCISLTDLTIEGTIGQSVNIDGSPSLTDASAQSVIDHLKDLTGATAQTLTFHRDVYDRLTKEQKATVAAKNWTLVRA